MVLRTHTDPVVVCVDDDPQVLTAVRRLLRREPLDLRTTEHPETALRWLGEGGVRLLITDLRMPDMDGSDLIKVVEERFPNTASLILTGYPGMVSAPGRPPLIAKPWNDGELKDVIRSLVKREPVDPGRLLVLGADERLRAQLAVAAPSGPFTVYWGGDHPRIDVVLVNADAMTGPLHLQEFGAAVVVLAQRPGPMEIAAWYEAGVGQVVRKPVSTDVLRAILEKCVRLARTNRREVEERERADRRRADETWVKRARRWVLARTLAPSRSRTGRARTLAGLTALAVLIGVLLASTFSLIPSLPPMTLPGGDGFSDRLWRMTTEDQSLRRWYLQQQLELGREMNDETRRYYEDRRREGRREPPRPIYPVSDRDRP